MTTRVLVMVCFGGAVLSFGAARWATDSRVEAQAILVGRSERESGEGAARGDGRASEDGGVPLKGSTGRGGEVEVLWNRIAQLERAGHSLPESRLAVLEAINGMNKEELRLLVESASDSADFTRLFRYDVKFAAQRLGELDPKVATGMWEKRGSNLLVASSMLAPWAARDPQAFGAWVTSLPANQQSSTSWVVSSIGANKPEQFAALASLLVDSPAGPSGAAAAMERMLKDAGGKGDPSAALAYANGLPEGAIRSMALATLAKWPGLDLVQHPEVTSAVGTLSVDDARKMGAAVSGNASKLPEGQARESAFSASLKGDAEKDPAAATKRLEGFAGSRDYPAAVLGFVDATAYKDPAVAADWALSIGAQSAAVRQQALERVAAGWFKTDPEGARAWVETAPVTEREYFILTGRVRSK